MNYLCIDASVTVKLVLKGESHRVTARKLIKDCIVNNIALIAPPFYVCEVDSVIYKRIHDSKLSLANAKKALAGLDKISIRQLIHPKMRQRAREIAEQFKLRTVYDATYAALAELNDCEFWTADKIFYDTVKENLAFVKYLPDYPASHQ